MNCDSFWPTWLHRVAKAPLEVFVLATLFSGASVPRLLAQSVAPGLTRSPIEVTTGYLVGTSSSSNHEDVRGINVDIGFNVFSHVTVDPEFHHLHDSRNDLSEYSFPCALEYRDRVGPLTPYIKGLSGIGFYSNRLDPNSGGQTVTTYMIGAGGGAELSLPRNFAVRTDYEYEHWISVIDLPNGVSTRMGSIGLTYKIPPWFGR